MSFTSCQTEKTQTENPLTTSWDTPYHVPPFDKIKPEHFAPAIELGMSLHNAEIDAITSDKSPATFENVIEAYDRAGGALEQTVLIFEMLCAAESNDLMRRAEEEIMPRLSAHEDRILMNEALFARIKTVYDERSSLSLDKEQLRLLEKTYRSFVRSGALLTSEQKERLQAINEELATLSVKYAANLLAENNNYRLVLDADELQGLPSEIREQARSRAKTAGKEGKYVFTLQRSSIMPFLSNSSNREKREEIYRAYLNRCNNDDEWDNKSLINDFVRLRTEKAHLLGYDSYADYVIADEMAGSTSAAYRLLREVWTPALAKAKEEYKALDALFQKDFPGQEMQSWDWWYYANKVRKERYALDEEQLRPYLSLDNVKSGIFFLANRLYGITFRPINVPVYHKDVSAYEVLDIDQKHLGILYFDFFSREGKSQGAWCGNYVEQSFDKEGELLPPVVSVVTNFNRPFYNNPALLSVDETETLFHEFGHALHFLFHRVKYSGLSDVEGDFVELPSQLMENWAFEPELLRQYAFHHSSHSVIPDHLINNLRNSRRFNQGFILTELIAASFSDLDIHSVKEYKPFDVNEFEKNALGMRRGLIPAIEPRYRYTYFSHIFDGGYSAGYYFYTWAEVLDKDAFEAFRESGDLFNRSVADRFRRRILSRGGSENGMELYRAFRGKDPDKDAYLKAHGLLDETPLAADSLSRPDSLEVPMMDGRYSIR